MCKLVRKVALVFGILLAAVGPAESAWNIQDIKDRFEHVTMYDGAVSVLHDGWVITFLSHDGGRIGAAALVEHKGARKHENSMDAMLQRISRTLRMTAPESLFFLNERKSALLMDRHVVNNLVGLKNNVFESSGLAAMVNLHEGDSFRIQGINENGTVSWRTIKRGSIGLRMPLAETRLSAMEVTGNQQLDEYSGVVLAGKLGLPRSSASREDCLAAARWLSCQYVLYMNSRHNMLLARNGSRCVIGTREGVTQMLRSRDYATVPVPKTPSAWPAEEKPESVHSSSQPVGNSPEKPKEPAQEPQQISPKAAREAYLYFIQKL
jgi:hypothetical protein